MRLISKKATLYTEMLHHGAVLHNHKQVLPFNPIEHPIVLQLGGCDPNLLAEAAVIGERYGYD
jgi:tRNA-dihydrouridine synthase A